MRMKHVNELSKLEERLLEARECAEGKMKYPKEMWESGISTFKKFNNNDSSVTKNSIKEINDYYCTIAFLMAEHRGYTVNDDLLLKPNKDEFLKLFHTYLNIVIKEMESIESRYGKEHELYSKSIREANACNTYIERFSKDNVFYNKLKDSHKRL